MTAALLESVEERVREADRADRAATVTDIAQDLGLPPGTVAYAARTLRSYGRVHFVQTDDMAADDGLLVLPGPDAIDGE